MERHADRVYLKAEVNIEPLVCRWYAWSHLIAPVQLALHLKYRILPLMRSFVDNPAVHISANSDPEMYGGPFVALRQEDVERVRLLIDETEQGCAGLLGFAEDFRAFDARLQESANGYSLNEYYAQLPESLQGLVELLYDTHHRPSIRTFEALAYDSGMTENTQQIMLQRVPERERRFFMSTPRVETPGTFSFNMKFSDPRIDALAAMRHRPGSFDGIAALLEIDEARKPAFRELFSAEPCAPKGDTAYAGPGMRMRYFGHACVLFQTAETSVLFDPFVSINDADDGRLTINDLPDSIDFVVLTHSHQDHFSPEMLIQMRHRIKRVVIPANNSGSVVDPAMKLTLQALGIDNVEVLDCYDRVEIPGGHILSLPFTGEHADLPVYSKHAVVLALGGRQCMFLVDSDGRDAALYRRMMQKVGRIDALFIGMECHGAPLNWLYEPLLGKLVNRRNNESRRLSGADCERASKILAEVKPHRVFVYAMGQEPWMQYIMGLQYRPDSIQLVESDKFIAHCIASDIQAERLYLNRETIL